jgi:hypothetical protein
MFDPSCAAQLDCAGESFSHAQMMSRSDATRVPRQRHELEHTVEATLEAVPVFGPRVFGKNDVMTVML